MKFQPEERLHFYQELSIYDVIDYFSDNRSATVLVHPALFQIERDDKAYHTSNMETLRAYLFYPGGLQKTADSLHIHKNTLLYRLARIRERYELDLDGGDVRLQLMFSFKVLHYMKIQSR